MGTAHNAGITCFERHIYRHLHVPYKVEYIRWFVILNANVGKVAVGNFVGSAVCSGKLKAMVPLCIVGDDVEYVRQACQASIDTNNMKSFT